LEDRLIVRKRGRLTTTYGRASVVSGRCGLLRFTLAKPLVWCHTLQLAAKADDRGLFSMNHEGA
jgi:hypothetical protein